MISITEILATQYQATGQQAIRAALVGDTVADLPADPSDVLGYTLLQGSTCHIIADSTKYMMQSTGTWIQQLSDLDADVYTRQQIDQMIQQLTATQDAQAEEIGVIANLGAKNILPISVTTQTVSGVDFVVDAAAGTITVTADGSQTASAFLYIVPRSDPDLRARMLGKSLTLTGCPAGGSGSTYRLRCWHYSGTSIASDLGSGVTFTFDNAVDPYDVSIQVFPGAVVNGLVFRPMIRPAQITDSSYQLYAPTNRELYEMI